MFVYALLLIIPMSARAAVIGIIDQIEIVGNDKTQAVTILQELSFSPGDRVTDAVLAHSEQAVQDLGIFESVTIEAVPKDGRLFIAKITVKEKIFDFVLPRLARNGDGDITTGVVWHSDNLLGLNQRSKLTFVYRTFEDTDKKNETRLEWTFDYPRIAQTPYSFSFQFRFDDTNMEETIGGRPSLYERKKFSLEPLFGKWLQRTGPSQGLLLQGGIRWERYDHEFRSGSPAMLPSPSVSALVMGVEGDYVHDLLLSRKGHHFGYKLTYAASTIGSEFSFVKHLAFYRKYIPLSYKEHANLNVQLRGGYITRSILHSPEFGITGSRSLRGYKRDSVEGNSFVLFNAEWLVPILGKETLRAATILDVGNAWESTKDARLSDLRYAVGIGLRWKLRRFVDTDIRLDLAKGFSSDGETRLYLGTNATF